MKVLEAEDNYICDDMDFSTFQVVLTINDCSDQERNENLGFNGPETVMSTLFNTMHSQKKFLFRYFKSSHCFIITYPVEMNIVPQNSPILKDGLSSIQH